MSDRTDTRPRRLAPRFPVALVVEVQVPGLPPVTCQARNLSLGGMFIATDSPVRPSSALTIRLTLPGGRSATVPARVVHLLPAEQARTLGLKAGVGVRFDELDHASKALVSELVEQAAARGPAQPVARIKPGADTTVVRREPLLGFVLGYIDGRRNLDALAQDLALETDTVERMLGQLCAAGVVELAPAASLPASGGIATKRPGHSQSPSAAPRASTRSSRAPGAVLADVTAASEAARVAAVSSMRPSQAAGASDKPAQPPASSRHASVRPSRPPTAGSARPPASVRPPSVMPPQRGSRAPQPDPPLGAAAQILAQAEAAFTAGRALEASRHLKLLAAMTFQDAPLAQRAAELRTQVLAAVAVELERQALQEEARKHWDKAAECWLRVAEGRPRDGLPLQRAALAQLQAGVEPRTVVEVARRAVQLAPSDAQAHRTLAKAYLAADMQASAGRALEDARRCGASNRPGEEAITTGLIKRLLGRSDPD